ncbi:cytochrome c [Pseudomonas sp. RIT-PI-AD]|uniref:c-type cytochrome n=1 Tax=Pseudomonas sp. RIT-PI-AD TaxID=3035294 RepID=UPI0021D9CE33|nr:cytochrome c [Pseudomonas sp. RIT-PI-AD]
MKTRIILPLLAVLALSACGGVDPNSPLGKRKAIFKDMLHTSEDLGGMLRGRLKFDEQRFSADALKLDQLSAQPWQHFPQAKEDKSSARDDVWQRQARFQALADDLQAHTRRLAEASAARPLEPNAVEPLVKRVEDSCEACHKEFRAY